MTDKPTLKRMVEDLFEDTEFFGPEGACPARLEPGTNERVLLITGGNASGKSFACRYLDSIANADKVEFMRVGMGRRTSGGVERGLMFGEEGRNSTGLISGNVIQTGIRTCQGRGNPNVLCLDEPDIGMSEEMQDAAGRLLAKFGADLPKHTLGLVVVTHSRQIAGRLLALDPVCIRMGDDPRPTREWVERGPREMSLEDFEAVSEISGNRRKAIQAVLNDRARQREDERASRPHGR